MTKPLPEVFYRNDLKALVDKWAKANGGQIDASVPTSLILFGVDILFAGGAEEEAATMLDEFAAHLRAGTMEDYSLQIQGEINGIDDN